MRLAILAAGSRGDVQPYVALGHGLQADGHQVRLLATPDFESLVTGAGLEFVPISTAVQAEAQARMQALAERGNLLEILSQTGRGAEELARESATRALTACQDVDALLAGLGSLFVALALAEKLDRPLIQAHLMPFTPTRAFPGVLTALPASPLTRWANAPSHHFARQMMWQMLRGADRRVRAEVLGLPPAPFAGPYAALARRTQAVLYGYSPHVIPPPP